ncbi:MAG: TonB-dependent receptor [Pseudoxanthomonas sp.]
MKHNKTLLSAAIITSLCLAAQAGAQEAAQQATDAQDLDGVVVTGIRGSVEKSLDLKRDAKSHVEVITAEDIGKMPDKNVADSLQRLPGVTISSAGATEGGFDENDRVSMRGTNPSLTLTQINGHPVASGDWFVLNQSDNAGRSVSYTLLPSELVSRVVVHKTSQASLAEGGVTGTVDIITRKPTEFTNPFTANVSIGAVYADLPGKTDPQFNALLNLRDENSVAGVLLQVFSETRHLRRDGVEVLGYDQVAAGSAVATSNPDLAGVWYPRMIGAALFEQERKRSGGLIELQVKPSDSLSFDLSAYYSKLDASNYNRNYLLYNPRTIGAGVAPDPGYVVRNNTLVSASFSGAGIPASGLYDMISRPDEGATTSYIAFDTDWHASDKLDVGFKLGTSTGRGKTPTQDVAEWATGHGTGGSWQLNGIGSAPSFSLNEQTGAPPASLALDWIFGLQNVDIEDKDDWAQIDAEYFIDKGVVSSLQFGVRAANHDRESSQVVSQGPNWGYDPFTNFPQGGYANYPGDYGSELGGGAFPRDLWYYTAAQMAAWNAVGANRDPEGRRYPGYEFTLEEKTSAAYAQLNFEGDRWNGNVGLRYVRTSEDVLNYVLLQNVGSPISGWPLPILTTPPTGSIDSAWGWWAPIATENDYSDVLPSANFKFDLTDNLVARVAASKTMTRPDYSALAGALNLSPPGTPTDVGGGSASNPNLKPVRATNFDTSLEWYYAPRAMLSASLFYMDLTSYVSQGVVEMQAPTFNATYPTGFIGNYLVTVPVNSSAKAKGVELAVEQPFGENFGISANYTYTDAEDDNGGPVVGASRDVYNVVGYFENDHFSARVAYNYRSHFFSGLDRSTAFSQDDTQSVSASLGWNINDTFSVSLDGMNLSNETLKYYALNKDQPRGIYYNGRQYYLTFRAKF